MPGKNLTRIEAEQRALTIRRVAGYEERDEDGMPDPADEADEAEAQRKHELALRGLDPTGKPIVKPTAPRLAA